MFRDSRSYGYSFRAEGGKDSDDAWRFDWGRMIANKNKELNRLEGIYRNMLDKAGVDLIEGRGVVLDPHMVQVISSKLIGSIPVLIQCQVNGKTVTAEKILVAAGGWPHLPKEIPGVGTRLSWTAASA